MLLANLAVLVLTGCSKDDNTSDDESIVKLDVRDVTSQNIYAENGDRGAQARSAPRKPVTSVAPP